MEAFAMTHCITLRIFVPPILSIVLALTSFATYAGELPFGGAAVTEDELGAIAGREDLNQANVGSQTSTVSHNSVNGNSVTGAISFDDQALQNLSGLALVNANTGNNVSMNSSMMVNIAIAP
jgi:hypothetical protein